ncbi:MAG: type II toxin-antitoxin system VapC family toxin [Isosphaeraceae bacterium]
MSDVLADTHSIVWFLFDPSRLSPAADAALTTAAESGKVTISAITLVEVNYLSGKKTFPYSGVFPRLIALASDPNERIEVLPLTLQVAQAMDLVPRAEVPDMPNRVVATTAVAYKLPLVSQDTEIRDSASLKALIPVIW